MQVLTRTDYDAIVIGARCAGASTAMLLARAGARVLVVERDRPGTDTMSTHALMRGAVFQLAKWGILPKVVSSEAQPVRRTSFHYGDEVIEVDIRPALGTDALYAPRRTVLDRLLVEEAVGAGAELLHSSAAVELILSPSGVVQGVAFSSPGEIRTARAPLVIGADGRRSWVARQLRAPIMAEATHSVCAVYCYADGLPNRGYDWFYDQGAGGGVIPTNDQQSVVFVAVPPGEGSDGAWNTARMLDRIERSVPRLAETLNGSTLRGPAICFSGAKGFRRQPIGPGWALVGDAGYFKDPITAHGITDAFRDAELLTGAVLSNRMHDYPEERDVLTQDFFRLTDRIASFDWSLPELKELHLDLNKSMKPTQERCAQGLSAKAAA